MMGRRGDVGARPRTAVTSPRVTPRLSDRSDRGDTLVEILLALIVLSLATVALLLGFSTSINASSTHRNLAATTVALEAVEQQAQSQISAQLALFSCPMTIANYESYVTLTVPSNPGSPALSAKLDYVEWWNGNGWTTSCVAGSAELVTLQVTGPSGTYSTQLIIQYPLDSTGSQGAVGTVPSKLVFLQLPSTSATFASGTAFDTADQPVVEVEDAAGNPVINDSSPVLLSLVSSTNGTLGNCAGPEVNAIVDFSGCTVTLKTGVTSASFSFEATDTSISNSPFLSNQSFTVSSSTASPQLVFLSTPTPGASGASMTPTSGTQFQIAVKQGTTTLTSWTGSISLTMSGSSTSINQLSNCTISGPTAGVFSVSGCYFKGGVSVVNGNSPIYYTMTATGSPTGSSPAVLPGQSAAFGVTGPGAATQLAFSTEPVGGSSSSTPVPIATSGLPVVIQALDSWGNTATGASGSVSLSVNPGTNLSGTTIPETLSSCPNASFTLGFATFTSCSASAWAQGVTLTATLGAITQKSTAFNVTGPASSLQFTTQPQAGPSGSLFVTQPVIGIFDANGYVVTADTASMSAQPTVTPTDSGVPQPQVTGCTDFSPTMGYISLTSCSFVGSEATQYTMTVTLGALTSSPSATFSPSGPGAPAKVVFAVSPVAGPSGSAFKKQPVLLVEDVAGNLTTASNVTVSLSASGGSLNGCANLTSVAGVVSVSNCQFSGVIGQNYTLAATSTGLTSGTSATFSPTAAGAPAQIAVASFPSGSVVAGTSLSGISFSIEDSYGNLVSTGAGSNDQLSVSLGGNPGNVSLLPSPNVTLTAVAGIATMSGESIDVAGTYVLTATDSSEGALPISSTVTTSPLSVVAAAPSQIVFSAQPSGGTGGVAWSLQPALTVEDVFGNVALTDHSTISLSINSGTSGATISGCSQSESNGVVTFSGCSINKPGTYTLLATDSSGTVATSTSSSFVVSVGPAAKLVFSQNPAGSVTEGTALTLQPVVQVQDAGGNLVTGDSSTVSLSVNSYAAGTSGGSTQGNVTGCVGNESGGVVTFGGCAISGTGAAGSYTLKATDSSGAVATAASTPAFSIVASPASKVAYLLSPPATGTAGSALTTFKVAIEDSNGNVITSGAGSTDTVSLSVASGPGGFNSAPATYTNVAAVSGVATFSSIVLDTSGNYTFTATDTTPGDTGFTSTGASSGTSITSGPGTKLVYKVSPPATGKAGTALSPSIQVYVEDSFGNLVTTNTGYNDTIALGVTSGPGTIASGASTPAVGGIATFSTTILDTAGNYTFTATDTTTGDTGFTSTGASGTTTISPAGASKLVFSTAPPATGTAGTALTTLKVSVEDLYGNLITTGTGLGDTLKVSVSTGPTGGVFTGGSTTSVAASNGTATFSNLVLNTSGTYTFTATDTTPGDTGFTAAPASAGTVVNSGPGTKLVYFVSPPATGTAGTALSPSVQVYVEDSFGNLVTTNTGSGDTIALGITTKPTGGAFTAGSTTSVAASGGIATFNNVALTLSGNYTFTATDTTTGDTGFTSTGASSGTSITSGPGTKLVYKVSPPATGTAGTALSPSIQVYVEDSFGNLVTTNTGSGDSITLNLASQPGGGRISSGGTVTASGGVATFSAVVLSRAGTYTFYASDTTTGDTGFTVTSTSTGTTVN